MITLEINGKKIEAEEGKSILQVAAENGIEIPHFCYHPGLPVSGNCRMCLVEIENIPKLQIACATPVRQDMKVFTETDNVARMRKGVLEFLLINHPIDCPVCDQAGECSLQDYYQKYGLYDSRFADQKVRKGKVIDLGSQVMLDQERCVLCTRCVRVMRDVVKDEQIGVFNRGNHSEIRTVTGKPLDSPYAGNVFDTCPVGALTSKDFRFKCRVWFLTSTPSVCGGCATGCNIYIDHNQNQVYRFRPRRNDDVNKHWMCDIGRYSYKQLYHEERPLDVQKKGNDSSLAAADYNDVIDGVSEKFSALLKEYGEKEVGFISGTGITNEAAFVLAKFIRDGVKTKNVDCAYKAEDGESGDNFLIHEDKNPNTQGCRDMGLAPLSGGMNVKDMLAAARRGTLRALFVVDTDLYALAPSQKLGITNALENIELLVVLHSRNNSLLDYAHYAVPLTMWPEQEGTFTNHSRKVQKVNQAVVPPDGVVDVQTFFQDLASRMGLDVPVGSAAELFEKIRTDIAQYKDLSYTALEAEQNNQNSHGHR